MKLCGSSLELGTFPAIDNEMSVQASDIFSKNLLPVSASFLLLCHCDSRCLNYIVPILHVQWLQHDDLEFSKITCSHENEEIKRL